MNNISALSSDIQLIAHRGEVLLLLPMDTNIAALKPQNALGLAEALTRFARQAQQEETPFGPVDDDDEQPATDDGRVLTGVETVDDGRPW